jgi:hypothetical protein
MTGLFPVPIAAASRFARLAVVAGIVAAVAAAQDAKKPTPVDLLKSLDPAKAALKGTWKMDGGVLVCPPVRAANLQVPAEAPEEYVLKLTVERTTGNNSFVFGVPLSGGKRAVIVLGANMAAGMTSGFDVLDGVPFDSNETAGVGVGFTNGKKAEIVCTVKKAAVTVTIDGKAATKYEGEFSRLTEQAWWKTKDAKAVMLGGWDSTWRISRLELTPGDGVAK